MLFCKKKLELQGRTLSFLRNIPTASFIWFFLQLPPIDWRDMALYNVLHKATIVCIENICRKGKLFMNNRKINNNKIVKKQKIRKFNEFQKSAVALAAAASFALTLSSCEDVAQSVETTSQRTQKEPTETQSTVAEETYGNTTLPFVPPPDIFPEDCHAT